MLHIASPPPPDNQNVEPNHLARIRRQARKRGFRILRDWQGTFSLVDTKIEPPRALAELTHVPLPTIETAISTPLPPPRLPRKRPGMARLTEAVETSQASHPAADHGHDNGHGDHDHGVDPGELDEFVALQIRARALGCWVGWLGKNYGDNPEFNTGPWGLFCGDKYHLVWGTGLSLAGIRNALDCIKRERELLSGEQDEKTCSKKVEQAWADFRDPGGAS